MVPRGMSLRGWGMVTFPGLVGCLKWWWLPRTATNRQPWLSIMRISSWLLRAFIATPGYGDDYTHVLSSNQAASPLGVAKGLSEGGARRQRP